MNLRFADLAIFSFLLLLVLYEFVPNGWKMDDHVGRAQLHKENQAFLQEASNEALETFLILSAMKAGLAVMSSSSAGISFIVDMNVQVGQLVSSSRDIVDMGWYVSIAGMAIIKGIKMLMEVLDTYQDFCLHSLIFVLMFRSLIFMLYKRPSKLVRSFIRGGLLITLLFAFGIPWAVGGMSVVSRIVTKPRSEFVRTELDSNHKDLHIQHDDDVKAQAKTSLNSYKKNSKALQENHKQLSERIVEHMSLVLFDAVLFPLVFLSAAFYAMRWASRQLSEFYQDLREEIKTVYSG